MNQLIKYDAACLAIAECFKLDEIRDWKDRSAAFAAYAKQTKNKDAENQWKGIHNRATIRMGELSALLVTSKGGANPKATLPTGGHSKKNVLADAGISHAVAQRAEQIAAAPEESKKALIAGLVSITQVVREGKERNREARREDNRAKVADVAKPITDAKFATIVIDPPWDWGDEGDKDQLGRAKPDYATMSIERLLELPVAALADVDCHIYLWITNRSLPKGFALLEKWGFRYITAITWVKPHYGLGNYFRGQTEHILFGVKGSQPLKRKDASTVFNATRGAGGHSSKPAGFYDLVESCSPGPYLEMFSRSDRPDWTAWGENSSGH